MRLTDEVDNVGTPAEKLRGCEHEILPRLGLEGTYAGQYDCIIVPLLAQSITYSPMWMSLFTCLTQKPALDVHLDNNRSVTATVGRTSNGTDPPMISLLRVCTNSLGVRETGGSDIIGTSRTTGALKISHFTTSIGDRVTPRHRAVPSSS